MKIKILFVSIVLLLGLRILSGELASAEGSLISFVTDSLSPQNEDGEPDEEESVGFGFIKSNEKVANFIGDGKILLYGGVFLISVSVLGIVITIFHKKRIKRNKRRRRR